VLLSMAKKKIKKKCVIDVLLSMAEQSLKKKF
jgi:hypothetical protein